MAKAPAFQMYSADFFMDTNHWTIEEMGIYTRLLLTEWSQGSLPFEIPRLARIAGCSSKKFQLWWGTISVKFIPNGDGKLINLRLEEEREKQRKYRELQSQKGKASAEKRLTTVITTVQPDLQPKGNSSSSSSLVNTKSTESSALPPLKNTPKEEKTDPLILELKDKAEKLYQQKIFPQVYAFLNKALQEKKNLKAIIHTFNQCLLNKPKEPWGYCLHILKIESGNFNEHDHTQKGKENNTIFLDIVEKLKLISGKPEEMRE